MTVAYIRWKDACKEDADDPGTPILEDPLIELHEVGWLIAETATTVSLAMELEIDERPARLRLHIPKVNIIEMRTLEFGKFPRKRRSL